MNILLLISNSILEFFGIGALLFFIKAFTNYVSILTGNHTKKIFQLIGVTERNEVILLLASFLVSIYIVKIVNNIFLQLCQSRLGFFIREEAVNMVAVSLIYNNLSKTKDVNSYKIIAQMSQISQGLNTYVKSICSFLTNMFVIFAVGLLLFLTIGTKLFFLFGFLGLISAIFVKYSKNVISYVSKMKFNISTRLSYELSSLINCNKDIQVYKKQEFFKNIIYSLSSKTSKYGVKQDFITSIPSIFLQTSIYISIVIIMTFFYFSNMNISQVIPEVIITILALQRLIGPILVLTNLYASLKQNSYSVRAFLDLVERYDITSIKSGVNSNVHNTQTLSLIECDISNFEYNSSNKFFLHDISLTFCKGNIYAILGKSGAGKSTILNIILGLIESDSVDININSKRISESVLSHRVGYVSQAPYILDSTILENIAFGEYDVDFDRVKTILKYVQLEDFIAGLPDGLNTRIGENGAKLSGGQRQRLALARALYVRPELLVIDEATSALDIHTERAFYDILKELKQSMITIIISHRITSLDICDKLFILDRGTIIEEGGFETVNKIFSTLRTVQ